MKRVFVFSRRSLFSQGIKNLLDAETGLTVVGWESDPEAAVRGIEATRPDAVLHITDGVSEGPTLTSESLIKLGIKTKLVELNLDDTHVYVYLSEQLTIREICELVNVI